MSADLAWLVLVVAAMVTGLVGIIVPVLPGLVLIVAAQLVWAIAQGSLAAWLSFGLGLLVAVVAWVLMYYLPGKRMQAAGIPSWVLLIAAMAGIVGFFVVPVIGLPLFFIGAIYAVESVRLRHAAESLSSTWQAIKASGLSILIELSAGMLAVVQWLVYQAGAALLSRT